MLIKIFMSTATSIEERNILKALGYGVQIWVDNNNSERNQFANVVRTGRWFQVGDPEHHVLDYDYDEAFSACDVAIMFGSWKPREKGHHVTRNSVAANSRCFVCIETPLLLRKITEANTDWRIGINGFLNRSATWPDLPDAVTDTRLADRNIAWSGWQHNEQGHIVVALQLPGDASLRGADINDWAYNTVLTLRQHTDRPIVVRNHPLSSTRAFTDHERLAWRLMSLGIDNLSFSDGAHKPWHQDLYNAYCTVTYSSGLAVDSVMNGIPTIACDPGNFAWGVSINDPANVENILLPNDDTMTQWLRSIMTCQWSLDEMKNGTAWSYLLDKIRAK